tara:strand:- start:5357 stop:6019 length:663 start_codon:yes stop_codon:yes gene_type:complete
MRAAGLKGRVVRVTRRQPGLKRFQSEGTNLLRTLAEPTAINQVWIGDVTYLKLNGQWQYLATVMDYHSRRILGWSLSATRTTALTCAAMNSALKKRRPSPGLLFHTDRGVEYAGSAFQQLLRDNGFRHGVNRPGQCTDNARMESFFHSLMAELIRETLYSSVKELRQSLSSYINSFYNAVRLHSRLEYLSPIKCEQRYAWHIRCPFYRGKIIPQNFLPIR